MRDKVIPVKPFSTTKLYPLECRERSLRLTFITALPHPALLPRSLQPSLLITIVLGSISKTNKKLYHLSHNYSL